MSIHQIAAGFAFAFTSAIQPFLTKIVVSTYHFNFPFTLLVLRFLIGLVVVEALRWSGYVKVPAISFRTAKPMLLASVCYSISLFCTVFATSGMNIPMFTAIRQCTPLATQILTVVVMKKPIPPILNILSVMAITIGCAFAGIGDMTFDGAAYTMCVISVLTLAMYALLIQEATQKQSVVEVFQINCYNILPFVLVGSYAAGELQQIWQRLPTLDAPFYIILCATSVAGNLLTYSMFMCTQLNSALTTGFIGVLKNIPQTLIGLFTFGGVSLNSFNVTGLSLNLMGGILYTIAKQRQFTHSKVV